MILTIHDDVEHLGRGAFGIVYRGSLSTGDRRPSVQVAVKQFYLLEAPHVYGVRSAAQLRPIVVSELLPEMNTLLRLVHPNLVRLRCVGIKSVFGMACLGYVATELCGEGTLRQQIDASLVSDVAAVSFVNDLVSVMSYLHVDKLVVHRDLKPDNIFVRSDVHGNGRPALVLGDLGLAKMITGTQARISIAGTPLYLAPEAAGGGAMCSLASDVYSASLVAVELVTGQCVHNERTGARDATRADELAAKAKARMTELLGFRDDVPLSRTACDLLLGACTHVAPTDRPTFCMIRRACNVGPAEAEAKVGAEAKAKTRAEAEAKARAQAEKAKAQAQGRLKRGSVLWRVPLSLRVASLGFLSALCAPSCHALPD
jgi:serine/threonine protein kinase